MFCIAKSDKGTVELETEKLTASHITIDAEFRSLIPTLAAEELSQLEENILADGCRDPLVVWNGVLVDGHHRYEICHRHAIEYQTYHIEFSDRVDAKIWIVRNQFGRRNISSYTRCELALVLEPLYSEKARVKMSLGGKTKGCLISDNPDLAKIDTKRELARIANVGHDTLHKAKTISQKANEGVKQALRDGTTSINAEYQKLTVHVGQNSGDNEWYTPADVIELARDVMGSIDCDPASSEIANTTVNATCFFTKEQDGLSQTWFGNVWLNPPYAHPQIEQFADAIVRKFHAGEITQSCVLVNNATETAWFQTMASQASAVCFPSSRIRFLQPNRETRTPLQGQCVIYLGPNADVFCSRFAQRGLVLRIVNGNRS